MDGRPTGVGDYWAARWRETWSVIKSEIGGHVRSVVGLVAAALFGPPVLRLLPFFSGTSRSTWDKLQADFWENVLISAVVVVALLALAMLIAALRAPYRLWRAAVTEGNSTAAQVATLQNPATDIFKHAEQVMVSLPPNSEATIEARYTDAQGATASLIRTPGSLTTSGNAASSAGENQQAVQTGEPPAAEDS